MIRVINLKNSSKYSNVVVITRKSIYGNPFHIGVDGDRDTVVEAYYPYALERYITDESFRESINYLVKLSYKVDLNLACVCHPLRCHGEKLKLLIEEIRQIWEDEQ